MTVEKSAEKASELIVIAQESGLEKTKVESLLSKFGDSFQAARHIVQDVSGIVVTDESQLEQMQTARQARLELKNIRVAVEHTRKELKEQSLREGKAIDGMANIIKALIVPVEDHLEKQEKFAENLAKERKARLDAQRLASLLEYTDSPEMYNYSDMSNESFDSLVAQMKEAKRVQEEAEKKAERERLEREKAEVEERERIRKENERLKAEAEAREKELSAERAAVAKAAEKAKAEADAREAALRAEREKAEAESQKKIEEERSKREAILEEQRIQAAVEAKKVAEAQESERQALLAPDRDKLLNFSAALETIRTQKLPAVKTKQAQDVVNQIDEMLINMQQIIAQKAKEL